MRTVCDDCRQPANSSVCALCQRDRDDIDADRNAEWWS